MTTVRLSNYQKKVLDEAKKQIDKARNCKSIYVYRRRSWRFKLHEASEKRRCDAARLLHRY